MVANEMNKFVEIFPIHRRRKYKDIPFFFSNLFQNHPVFH
jgi:hypothetical protein